MEARWAANVLSILTAPLAGLRLASFVSPTSTETVHPETGHTGNAAEIGEIAVIPSGVLRSAPPRSLALSRKTACAMRQTLPDSSMSIEPCARPAARAPRGHQQPPQESNARPRRDRTIFIPSKLASR
jgi:hypothetical protein